MRDGGGARVHEHKGFLAVHIAATGAWLGIDVVMGTLALIVLRADDATRALCYRALELFGVWPLSATGPIRLAGGAILGLGTVHGLVRHWWVAIKPAPNIVLVALVPIAPRPGGLGKAERGRRFAARLSAALAPGDLLYPPIVSPSALLPAMILAVFKPWGQIRRRRSTARETR